jgi:hypothetical protein
MATTMRSPWGADRDGATCNGTYRWKQAHDASNNHNATFWWKTRSERVAGPALIASLPAD